MITNDLLELTNDMQDTLNDWFSWTSNTVFKSINSIKNELSQSLPSCSTLMNGFQSMKKQTSKTISFVAQAVPVVFENLKTITTYLIVLYFVVPTRTQSNSIELESDNIVVDGLTRRYSYSIGNQNATKLLVGIHGGGNYPEYFFSNTIELSKWTDLNSFHLLLPEASGQFKIWSSGGDCCGLPGRLGVDDVKFINSSLTRLINQKQLNIEEIYIFGGSSGGMMAQYYGCRGNSVTGIFSMAGVLTASESECQFGNVGSLFTINSKTDTNIPTSGGPGSGYLGYSWPPQVEARRIWSNGYNCNGTSTVDHFGYSITSYLGCLNFTYDYIITDYGDHGWLRDNNGPINATPELLRFTELPLILQPSLTPSGDPSSTPNADPSVTPNAGPSRSPSINPSSTPSDNPSSTPSDNPSSTPSGDPSSTPSDNPSSTPSDDPSSTPSGGPSSTPSDNPSSTPSGNPSSTPNADPSITPIAGPSRSPSINPSYKPSDNPSSTPSGDPSSTPSDNPSSTPSDDPSSTPSGGPSSTPSDNPSSTPSGNPSSTPNADPSITPIAGPSRSPSINPSYKPSGDPSSTPSSDPSSTPSGGPSSTPSGDPSSTPSSDPSSTPSDGPSSTPSDDPSSTPSGDPSEMPSEIPSSNPNADPTIMPIASSITPSRSPSINPSFTPNDPSAHPSVMPNLPVADPSNLPVVLPTVDFSITDSPESKPPVDHSELSILDIVAITLGLFAAVVIILFIGKYTTYRQYICSDDNSSNGSNNNVENTPLNINDNQDTNITTINSKDKGSNNNIENTLSNNNSDIDQGQGIEITTIKSGNDDQDNNTETQQFLDVSHN